MEFGIAQVHEKHSHFSTRSKHVSKSRTDEAHLSIAIDGSLIYSTYTFMKQNTYEIVTQLVEVKKSVFFVITMRKRKIFLLIEKKVNRICGTH